MVEADNNQSISPPKSGMVRKIDEKKVYIALIVLFALGVTAVFMYEERRINTLNSQYSSLQNSTKSLEDKNNDAMSMNTNLQKANAALKKYQDTKASSSVESTEEDTNTNQKATSSFKIDKVQKLPDSEFGGELNQDVLAVTVTIKNLGTEKQTYSTGNFIAITDTGVVERINWAMGYPGVGNFWMESSVVPGGSVTQVLAWHYKDYESLGFSTIEFSPPDSTPTQSLPLPALSN